MTMLSFYLKVCVESALLLTSDSFEYLSLTLELVPEKKRGHSDIKMCKMCVNEVETDRTTSGSRVR